VRGHALGLTEAVNAYLAWRLQQPVVLSLDADYSRLLAPGSRGERPLEVIPG
jgi:uncharacterized protein